jgi:glycosyltransferase involved in cell wall biosynthesis
MIMLVLAGLLALLLIAASFALASFWAVAAWHAARVAVLFPTARSFLHRRRRAGDDPPSPAPAVCVLVPAHNEEAVIADLAHSLLAQDYPAMRVVFVLDRCTDRTRERLERVVGADGRFEILDIDRCPADWAGKVHALWTAASSSPAARSADLLLFADADTILDPRCVRSTVGLLRARGLDMLTLLSTLTADRWFERVVQPATAIELVRQYPLERVNRYPSRRPFANGQFILFRRDAYDRIGGHSAVKAETFEDVRLAQHAGRNRLRLGAFLADHMLYCRMYKDWDEFQRGWNRIYSESCNRRPRRLRKAARVVLTVGTCLPAAAAACVLLGLLLPRLLDGSTAELIGEAALVAGAASLAWFFLVLAALYRLGGMPVWTVLFYPVGAWLASRILRQTADDLEHRRPVLWGGRAYARAAR